jgi:Peptidase propeptide and YPEB domain.
MRPFAAALAASLFAISTVHAAAPLTEEQAREKATNILLGDPYGSSAEDVAKTIKDAQLLSDGKSTPCGTTTAPVWQFHVVVESPVTSPGSPIDGYLVVDAESGKLVCANLPMLD